MKVSEFFAALSYGELSNLSIGTEGTGSIKEADQPKVIGHLNNALTQLYSRFAHKIDYVILRPQADLQRYVLDPAYAVSDTDAANTNPRYLIDTEEDAFLGNLIKIRSILQLPNETLHETEPLDLLINGGHACGTLKTLSWNTLFIETPDTDHDIRLEYQAKHSKLSIPVVLTEEIEVHPLLEEALVVKVASRIFASMLGEENAAKAQRLEAQYEYLSGLVDAKDILQQSSSDAHGKLIARGFR